jgi:hypothetical protein
MPVPRIALLLPFPQLPFPFKHVHLSFPLDITPAVVLRPSSPFRRFGMARVLVDVAVVVCPLPCVA